ncbi:MAG: metallophosphoesterase family protein [Terrimicrobiaceae bacterium]
MKILIISDIHSNYEALLTVAHAEKIDVVWCLGDIVDFGPLPSECVQWVRHHVGQNCVRGNHDHALAFDVDCGSSESFHDLSALSRAMNRELLHVEQIEYLLALPVFKTLRIDGFRFHLSHASPDGDLYKSHLQPDISDASLAAEIENIDADFILCGHTHLPMVREIDGRIFVNPGSVGLPLDGNPQASYAVFHDGAIKLRRAKYDVEKMVSKLRQSTLPVDAVERLAEILRTGRNAGVAIPSNST